MKKTAYEILGVSEKAKDEEIKRQYHILMRSVHSDVTSLKDLTEEERQQCEKLVREYNEAYAKLSKGKRADYDRKLAQQRERSRVINSESSYSRAYGSDRPRDKGKTGSATKKSDAHDIMNNILKQQLDEWMSRIFTGGYSFSGSFTTDPNEKLKQDYWNLKSKMEKLERDLRIAMQEVEIEFGKSESINEIQLNMEFEKFFYILGFRCAKRKVA